MGTSSLGSPIWTAASKGIGCHYNLKKVRLKPSHFIRSNETLCLNNSLGETESGVEDAWSNTSSAPPVNILLGESEVLLPGLWSLLWIFAKLPGRHGKGIPLHFSFFKKINLFILIGGWLLTILWWVLPYTDMNQPQVYMCSPSWAPSHLPPYPIPQGHPSAPAPSTLSHALNLDGRSISHMIIYMFQCYSLRSSHPHLLPQSPKDCSLHLYLFCCIAYRVIITSFLNSIYMCQYTVLVFFFLTYLNLYNWLQFHPPH